MDTSPLNDDKHAFVSIYAIFRTRFLVYRILSKTEKYAETQFNGDIYNYSPEAEF